MVYIIVQALLHAHMVVSDGEESEGESNDILISAHDMQCMIRHTFGI